MVIKGESGGVSARFRESAGLTDGFRLCLGSMCVDVNIGFNPITIVNNVIISSLVNFFILHHLKIIIT